MAELEQLKDPVSRRRFLAVGGSTTAVAAFLAACGDDSGTTTTTSMQTSSGAGETAEFGKGDIGILNYALTLEYLEAAFYNEATANNKKKTFLKGAQEQAFLKRVTADENAHVAFLEKALGSKAVAAPKVDFGNTTASETAFIKTAVALENTGVGAYSGQALNIVSPAYAAAALSIWSVEARHASVAGLLLKPTSKNLSPNGAFDEPKTAAQVLKAVEATGFLR
jgi:rubrerythrin